MVGYFLDSSFVNHSLLRTPDGTITPINDIPNSDPTNTFVNAINPSGIIIGQYFAPNLGIYRGFVRDRKGNYTNIDGPNSPFATSAMAINPAGEITGSYQDANFPYNTHGFVLIPAD